MPRIELYLHFDRPMVSEELASFKALIKKRARKVPVQYLTGHQGFRYIELDVAEGVLIPRQETEIVVDLAKELIRDLPSPLVLDLGTGSGAIALSIAKELPHSSVVATDNSDSALQIAKSNLARLKMSKVELIKSDLFSGLTSEYLNQFDLIVSNPPYIDQASFETLPPEVKLYEPKTALIGGKTGLEVIFRIIEDSSQWLKDGGSLLLEIGGAAQARKVQKFVEEIDQLTFEAVHKDLTGTDRFVQIKKSEDRSVLGKI